MKSIKIIITASLCVFLLSGLMAQKPGHRTEKDPASVAQKKTERLVEELGLNDVQHEQVYNILLASTEKVHNLREELGEDREAMKERRKQIKEGTHSELSDVLSADQMVKLEEMHKARKGKRGKGMRGEGKRGEAKAKLGEELNLSPTQKTEMKQINESFREEMRALRESAGDDKSAIKPEMKALREQKHDAIMGMLDAEQQAKFEACKAECKDKKGAKGGKAGKLKSDRI